MMLRHRTAKLVALAVAGALVGAYAGWASPRQPGAGSLEPSGPPPVLPATVEPVALPDIETLAIGLASSLSAVPLGPDTGEACPRDRLVVSWEDPGAEYRYGAFIPPLGPAPGPDTDEVNGVVLCAGAPYGFMGFEAARDALGWELWPVPYVHEEDHEHKAGHDHPALPPNSDADPGPAPAQPPAPAPPPADLAAPAGPIEAYAVYEGQSTCDPTAKPGALALRDLLVDRYPGTRNLGIVRGCSVGGRSEHKEGRAFDWGVLAGRPAERAAAEDFLALVLATDDAGNRHALARRMGIMYMIWDRKIWTAYRSPDTWRPYSGASPHTDHVHFSLSWAGARGQTSYWQGAGVQWLATAPAPAALPVSSGVGSSPGVEQHPAPPRPAKTPMPADTPVAHAPTASEPKAPTGPPAKEAKPPSPPKPPPAPKVQAPKVQTPKPPAPPKAAPPGQAKGNGNGNAGGNGKGKGKNG